MSTTTFRQWLKSQANRNDEIGTFAQQVIDRKPPTTLDKSESKAKWRSYFESINASYENYIFLEWSWAEYALSKKWTKEQAIKRVREDKLLQEIIAIEPRVLDIISQAEAQVNRPGYHRIKTYNGLKGLIKSLVGFNAEKKELRTMVHYDIVVKAVNDLLPPDDVDLFPDGKPRL